MTALVLTLLAAAAVGLTLGMLGGGGSILTVPVLIYLAGMPAKPAIAASLFVVGATSLVGLVAHARAGRVRWRTGLLFGVAGMAGAYAGGRAAEHLPTTALLVGFGLMMAATAGAMLRPTSAPAAPDGSATPVAPAPHEQRLAVILAEGASVGLITGLVGAGGGFVVVPALVVLGGLSMPTAVGTSLLVITMQTSAGFAGHLHGVHLDWPLIGAVTALAVVGVLAGGRLVGRINAQLLRRAFGWFVVAMAVVVLGAQIPPEIRGMVPRPVGAGLVLVVAGGVVGLGWVRRRRAGRPVTSRVAPSAGRRAALAPMRHRRSG